MASDDTEQAQSTAPDDIDARFAPRVRPDVVAVPVGDDIVLLGQFGQAHVLDPIGALVWQFLDGEVALHELTADFAEVLGADPIVVEDDIVEFTRLLGRIGLLDGVAEPIDFSDLIDLDWEPPEPVAVGETLDPFTFPDLDGTETSIEAWRGREVLLVNWSPGCGFCVKIAAALGSTQAGLAEHDIDLVFVTSGTADDNRRVFEDAGLQSRALLKQDDIDPFSGFGTPSAYLLDGDGRVARPMAYGADEVPRIASELAGVELGDDEPHPAELELADGLDEARYLPAPSAVCGPGGGGGADGSSTTWVGTRAFRVGEFHVGVRHSSDEGAEILDRLFEGARVRDPRVPDNYSVALYPAAGGASRKLNLLVQGSTQLVRSRSAARALAALLTYISAETAPDLSGRDEGLLRLNATAAIRDGAALLLPAGLVAWIKALQPRLARLGIVLVDGPSTLIDPRARELVVPQPWMPYDASVLESVDEGLRLGAELPYVRPGRYPLTDWYVPRTEDEVGPVSGAIGVASAYPLVFDPGEPRAVGKVLADVFEHVRTHGIWFDSPETLTSQLGAD